MAADIVSIETIKYDDNFLFKVLAKNYQIAVDRFHFDEKISVSFDANFWLVSEDKINFNDVIHQEALFTIKGTEDDRYFHGIINHFMLTGKSGRFYFYQASLAPSIWFLSLNKNFRIFQNMTTEDIVSEILEENHILSDCYEFRLSNDYQPRRYCTQYGESDLHFISRLLEEEGVFYFFEHTEDNHLLIFADDTVAYTKIGGDSEIDIKSDTGMAASSEVIDNFGYVRSVRPGKVIHTNYNFKRPSLDLKVEAQGNTHEKYEIYEYPGAYGLPNEGELNTQLRLEEKKTLEESAQGSSNCARFIPGYTFKITCHDFDELNKEYLLVSVIHKGSQSHVRGEYSGIGGDASYSNEFLAIPATITLRPKITFNKPHVRGLQSAVVTGPEGSEIHTDEYGRIKVQFHWDREGQKNDKSSCWLRTSQPWSGNGWGIVSLPRVGDEVLVDFLNGDPDWPIMVGNLNNAASPALYKLPANKTQSGIKTRSTPDGTADNFNELRFEDKKGAEEVFLQAEKDWNIKIKNNETKSVGTNLVNKIGKMATITAGEQLQLVCGNASIVLDKSGKIVINGTEVKVSSSGTLTLVGSQIKLN